jgi:hypothetical protein
VNPASIRKINMRCFTVYVNWLWKGGSFSRHSTLGFFQLAHETTLFSRVAELIL